MVEPTTILCNVAMMYRKVVLPAFRVTKRWTTGEVVERDVPRGFKSNYSKEEELQCSKLREQTLQK